MHPPGVRQAAEQPIAQRPTFKNNANWTFGGSGGDDRFRGLSRHVNIRKPWYRIRKAANIEGVRIHDLRHSFASIAVSGGLTLPLIGKLLGHKKSATTERYAHLADNPVRAANEQVARLLGR